MSGAELIVRDLGVRYRVRVDGRERWLQALQAVSFTLAAGTTLGVIGESGSGKSTLARALLRLVPAGGSVQLDGRPLLELEGSALRAARRHMQMIFQDPLASLDPRQRIEAILTEPLRNFEPALTRAQRQQRARAALAQVGLQQDDLRRYPHEFSGGQAQRIGIARALIQNPALLVCDEPVAALDVSIRAQIVNLLRELQRRSGLTLLFIGHDLATIRHLADQVLVLYLGRVMELAPRDELFARPLHPYTRALLAAVPQVPATTATTQPRMLRAELPSPLDPPGGCVFRTRCPLATTRCASQTPAPRSVAGRLVACHLA